jgi:xanthine dehydrogenase accessory factor
MRDVLAELMKALDQGRSCVYCCLVETRGSTPQKAGATMLVFPDGSQRGTLGGGCVEAEVRQRSLRVLADGAGRPELLTFHLDDNYGWDDGLICGGRMSILADPIEGSKASASKDKQHYYGRFYELIEQGGGCTEAAIIADKDTRIPLGSRYLFDADGKLAAHVVVANGETQCQYDGALAEVIGRLRPLQARPQPAIYGGIAYLPVLPRVNLLIVGGGHVGQAVARLAAEVDFDVWVLDDRERYACRERFPAASRLLVGDIGVTLKDLLGRGIGPSTFCLIVTRGHAHDEEALYHLAQSRARYVGMIGSKRKIRLIYEDLLAKGISQEALDRVHAPLGFAIGSQTVPEIAISIIAELIACRNLGKTIPEARIRVTT